VSTSKTCASYPYWAAMAQLDLAQWLAEQNRNQEAASHAAAAAETFERLGAAPDVERARRLLAVVPA
jgi:hypothetical protein